MGPGFTNVNQSGSVQTEFKGGRGARGISVTCDWAFFKVCDL